MWIVELGLQSPYTFIILAILLLLLGVVTIARTAADISRTGESRTRPERCAGISRAVTLGQPGHRVPRRS